MDVLAVITGPVTLESEPNGARVDGASAGATTDGLTLA